MINLHGISFSLVSDLANQHGLKVIGVAEISLLSEDLLRLQEWQEAGFSAEMKYMQRSAAQLAQPANIMQNVRSIISLALPYSSAPVAAKPESAGRVARYAWGMDYHEVLKARLNIFAKELFGESQRSFSDAVPLLERALARRAGLGFIGKNTMLIRPGHGSLFFLAEILTSFKINDYSPPKVNTKGCSSCTGCLDLCPTKAFVAPYTLDARRCISYLTIEKRGAFNKHERSALGEWLFGCDICQEVCPFNQGILKSKNQPKYQSLKLAELSEFQSVSNSPGWLDLVDILSIRTDSAFKQRFKGSAILRAKRVGLLRNAACVAANTEAELTAPVLIEAALSDISPIVRQHAYWAIFKLLGSARISSLNSQNSCSKQKLRSTIELGLKDPALEVKNECQEILAQL